MFFLSFLLTIVHTDNLKDNNHPQITADKLSRLISKIDSLIS